MDVGGLRRATSVATLAATIVTGAAIAAHPLPAADPAPQQAGSPAHDIAAREARAAARLRLAERRLRAVVAASRGVASAPAPAPVVSVAPPPATPVTQSASS